MQRQSGNSKTKYVFSLCAILAVILGAGYYIFSSRPLSFQYELFSDVSLSLDEEADLTPYAKIGDSKISVEVVKDNESIRKGLSGRLSMEEDRGMLFVFSIPGIYRFWMPDMHFPSILFGLPMEKLSELKKMYRLNSILRLRAFILPQSQFNMS